MELKELAILCAAEIRAHFNARGVEGFEYAEGLILGALNRAIDEHVSTLARAPRDEAGVLTETPTPVVTVESGHISLDVTVNAKGDYQYGAKVVMPIVPSGAVDLDASNARVLAGAQLEMAEAFLKERYGRATP